MDQSHSERRLALAEWLEKNCKLKGIKPETRAGALKPARMLRKVVELHERRKSGQGGSGDH